MTTSPKLVRVGVIASAHGVKGQVKVKCFTEKPETLLTFKNLTDSSGKRSFKLKKQGVKNDLLIVSIDGVDDRNTSELLKGTELFAPAPTKKNTNSNEWTYGELTGLEARLENGKAYGKVIGVYNFGAGDIIEIQLLNEKTEMLPLNDEFIGAVNIDKSFMVVFPPDYLDTEEKDE